MHEVDQLVLHVREWEDHVLEHPGDRDAGLLEAVRVGGAEAGDAPVQRGRIRTEASVGFRNRKAVGPLTVSIVASAPTHRRRWPWMLGPFDPATPRHSSSRCAAS